MALSSLRLRRALSSVHSLHRHLHTFPAAFSFVHPLRAPISASAPATPQSSSLLPIQCRTFRSSSITLSASPSSNKADDNIKTKVMLFEGCDYKHWLFVVSFPRDPKPSPEQMVAKYEEVCAKGLNISIEEAKSKIYACSTTVYEGFQAVMSEEEAENFHNIPEVVFVLPDSYLYPETKEYGGDKYINGQVIPRPPPVQNQRQPPRSRDRGTRPHQPVYNRQGGPVPDRQGNPSYNRQGSMQGVGSNSVPPGQREGRGPVPSCQSNSNQWRPGNHPQEQREQRGYAPPEQRGFSGDNRNYAPVQRGGSYGQGPSAPDQKINGAQTHKRYEDGQIFSQMEQRDFHGDPRK